MLSKRKRLNLRKAFSWVRSGKYLELADFKLYYRYGENDHALVGIAVNRKYFRKAVSANRARRLASKAVELKYLQLRPNINLVMMPKESILASSVDELVAQLENVSDLY